MTRPQVVVATARAPAPRHRLAENQPERRRELILGRLCAAGAAVDLSEVQGDDAALERLVSLGCVSADKLDFLRSAHAAWRAAPSPESDFASTETAVGLDPDSFRLLKSEILQLRVAKASLEKQVKDAERESRQNYYTSMELKRMQEGNSPSASGGGNADRYQSQSKQQPTAAPAGAPHVEQMER